VNQPPPGYGPPPGYPAAPGYPPPPPGYAWPAPPPPVSPAGVPLADFAQRFAAYLIDSALVSVVALVLFIPALVVVVLRLPDPESPAYGPEPSFNEVFADFLLPVLLLELGFFVFMFLLYYLYAVEFMHRSGQTLGKKALKIRVVPIDPALRLTRGMAAKRYLIGYVAASFVPFLNLLDGLWQLWDKPYQQTLHDKVAQTVVVKVSP